MSACVAETVNFHFLLGIPVGSTGNPVVKLVFDNRLQDDIVPNKVNGAKDLYHLKVSVERGVKLSHQARYVTDGGLTCYMGSFVVQPNVQNGMIVWCEWRGEPRGCPTVPGKQLLLFIAESHDKRDRVTVTGNRQELGCWTPELSKDSVPIMQGLDIIPIYAGSENETSIQGANQTEIEKVPENDSDPTSSTQTQITTTTKIETEIKTLSKTVSLSKITQIVNAERKLKDSLDHIEIPKGVEPKDKFKEPHLIEEPYEIKEPEDRFIDPKDLSMDLKRQFVDPEEPSSSLKYTNYHLKQPHNSFNDLIDHLKEVQDNTKEMHDVDKDETNILGEEVPMLAKVQGSVLASGGMLESDEKSWLMGEGAAGETLPDRKTEEKWEDDHDILANTGDVNVTESNIRSNNNNNNRNTYKTFKSCGKNSKTDKKLKDYHGILANTGDVNVTESNIRSNNNSNNRTTYKTFKSHGKNSNNDGKLKDHQDILVNTGDSNVPKNNIKKHNNNNSNNNSNMCLRFNSNGNNSMCNMTSKRKHHMEINQQVITSNIPPKWKLISALSNSRQYSYNNNNNNVEINEDGDGAQADDDTGTTTEFKLISFAEHSTEAEWEGPPFVNKSFTILKDKVADDLIIYSKWGETETHITEMTTKISKDKKFSSLDIDWLLVTVPELQFQPVVRLPFQRPSIKTSGESMSVERPIQVNLTIECSQKKHKKKSKKVSSKRSTKEEVLKKFGNSNGLQLTMQEPNLILRLIKRNRTEDANKENGKKNEQINESPGNSQKNSKTNSFDLKETQHSKDIEETRINESPVNSKTKYFDLKETQHSKDIAETKINESPVNAKTKYCELKDKRDSKDIEKVYPLLEPPTTPDPKRNEPTSSVSNYMPPTTSDPKQNEPTSSVSNYTPPATSDPKRNEPASSVSSNTLRKMSRPKAMETRKWKPYIVRRIPPPLPTIKENDILEVRPMKSGTAVNINIKKELHKTTLGQRVKHLFGRNRI